MFDISVETVKKILGEKDYEEIKEFFWQFIIADCDYKVLLTRRSYVLYKIFFNIFLQEKGKSTLILGKIYNTHSLYLIPKRAKKVLVCDDIIVNGRTMEMVVKKLESKKVEKVPIWCLRCNTNASFLPYFEEKICHGQFVQPHEWELLSDKLTDVIIVSNVGYVSFVNSYEISSSFFDIVKSRVKSEDYSIETKSLNFSGVFRTNCFCTNDKLIDERTKKEFKLEPLLRFYKSTDRSLVIPFVFLPPIKAKDMVAYCQKVGKEFGFGLPQYFVNDCEESENNDREVLLYEWITNRLSKCILDRFFSGYPSLNDNSDICFSVINVSETFAFDPDISDITSEMSIEYLSEEYFPTRFANQDICDAKKRFQIDIQSGAEKGIDLYLAHMRKEDDLRAKKKEVRCFGLLAIDALHLLSGNNSDIKLSALATLIIQCDKGKFSYVIAPVEAITVENESEIYIAGVFRHGEQAFRSLYMSYKDEFEVINIFFNRTHETRERVVKDFVDFYSSNHSCGNLVKFFKEIDFDNFYADMTTVSPKSLGIDIVNAEVKKNVMQYVDAFYRS